MEKIGKILVLLVLIGCLIAGVMWWSQTQNPPPGPNPPTIESAAPAKPGTAEKPRVEEKYGFTSEGVGGG
ncbi:MAG: hypothetical protein AB7Q17_09475 [Phycisphaerae bacterium]